MKPLILRITATLNVHASDECVYVICSNARDSRMSAQMFDNEPYSPAARGGNLAKIPSNQVIVDFGRGSSVESESE